MNEDQFARLIALLETMSKRLDSTEGQLKKMDDKLLQLM